MKLEEIVNKVEMKEEIKKSLSELEKLKEEIVKNNDFDKFDVYDEEHLEDLAEQEEFKIDDFKELIDDLEELLKIDNISDKCFKLEEFVENLYNSVKQEFKLIDSLYYDTIIDKIIYMLEKNVLYVPSRKGHLVEFASYYEGIQDTIVTEFEDDEQLSDLINCRYNLIFEEDLDKLEEKTPELENIVNKYIESVEFDDEEEDKEETIKEIKDDFCEQYDRIIHMLLNCSWYNKFNYNKYTWKLS